MNFEPQTHWTITEWSNYLRGEDGKPLLTLEEWQDVFFLAALEGENAVLRLDLRLTLIFLSYRQG